MELHDTDGDTVVLDKSSQCASIMTQSDLLTMVDDLKDLSYEPDDSQATSQSSVAAVTSIVTDQKFVVFESQLDQLLEKLICPLCHSPCNTDDVVKKCNEGTLLHVVVHCISGHLIIDWLSQPRIGLMPAGNLLVSAATLFSGQTFTRMQYVADFLHLKFMSPTPFYEIQRTNLIPVIMAAWTTHQQSLFEELHQEGRSLRVCGDGRMDSPGFSAKYCTYSLMDMVTDKVISFTVVDVSEAGGSSTNMEVLAFERCLQQLLDGGFTVEVVATDRHVQVRSCMKQKYPGIRHQFDVWHLAKCVRKKLQSVSRKKLNTDLLPWCQSICNHLWWSAANCDQSPDLLQEIWSSIVHHTVNVHEFTGDAFVKCGHPPLTDDDQQRKKWLVPHSPAHDALKTIVLDRTLLKDIRQLSEFCHTGKLEVYHSLMTKYCPKRQEFDFAQMTARTALAVLDHNNNTDRPQKTTSEGKPCFKVAYTKTSARWVAKPVYDAKQYDYVSDMMHSVVEQQESRSLPAVASSHHNVAPIPAPARDELLLKHYSRFK